MTIIYSILFFLIGLALGSFLNVVILRMDELKTIVSDRSHCPSCKKTLAWYDLIPFLSFLMLKAKCRYCSARISWQYPLVELGTALLFVILYLNFGLSWGLLYYLVVFLFLIVIFVYDIKTQTVPEIFAWIALLAAITGGWHFGEFSFLSGVIGAVIAGGFLAVLVYFSKEKWMGAGDIKIGLILGFLIGYPNVFIALFGAFVFGSIVGIILIFAKNKTITRQSLKISVPFTPFLIAGILFALVIGAEVFRWYTHLFIAY
jgi:leader peptidase (prepilin peptidase) / N-methyltransferase